MPQTTTAIFENGVLRPIVALDLAEHSEVKITIHSSKHSLSDRVSQALASADLLTPRSPRKPVISGERRAELAEIFSAETPLGVHIREDRDAR